MKLHLFNLLSLFCLISTISIGQKTIGTLSNTPEALNAYTFFSVTFGKKSYLVDNCGEVINEWSHNNTAGLAGTLLPDGRLLRTSRINHSVISQTSQGGLLEIYSWDGEVEWSYDFTDDNRTQHHDVVYMPNGNILVLAWEYIDASTVRNLGRNTNKFPLRGLYGEAVYEVKPIGLDSAEIVWEWHLRDRYIQEFDSIRQNYVNNISDFPHKYDFNYEGISRWSTVDWTHCNAIDYNESRDEILINCRNGNELWVIDHSTTTQEAAVDTGGFHGHGGDFIYRWGGPGAYGQGTVDDIKLYGAHGLEWIPENRPFGGSIIAFNNGIDRPGPNYSTIEVITPSIDSNGHYVIDSAGRFMPANATHTFEESNAQSFYSRYQSNAQYMPNGNLFTNRGDDGHFTEFDSLGNVVWDYLNPAGSNGPAEQGEYPGNSSVFTATRLPVDHPAFDGKDLTPTGVIELNSTFMDCEIFSRNEIHSLKNWDVAVIYNQIDQFISVIHNPSQVLRINIYSMAGKIIYSGSSQYDGANINSSNWPMGGYIVVLSDQHGQTGAEKILKF